MLIVERIDGTMSLHCLDSSTLLDSGSTATIECTSNSDLRGNDLGYDISILSVASYRVPYKKKSNSSFSLLKCKILKKRSDNIASGAQYDDDHDPSNISHGIDYFLDQLSATTDQKNEQLVDWLALDTYSLYKVLSQSYSCNDCTDEHNDCSATNSADDQDGEGRRRILAGKIVQKTYTLRLFLEVNHGANGNASNDMESGPIASTGLRSEHEKRQNLSRKKSCMRERILSRPPYICVRTNEEIQGLTAICYSTSNTFHDKSAVVVVTASITGLITVQREGEIIIDRILPLETSATSTTIVDQNCTAVKHTETFTNLPYQNADGNNTALDLPVDQNCVTELRLVDSTRSTCLLASTPAGVLFILSLSSLEVLYEFSSVGMVLTQY